MKRDIMELRLRMSPDAHNITYLAGCLVEPDGDIMDTFRERLVDMRGEEYYKYLNKIRQIFPYKKYGDAVIEAGIQDEDTEISLLLKRVIKSGMKDDDGICEVFGLVRAAVHTGKRHVILLWNDIYDIVKTNKNNESLDESEETLNYIGCMVCPVDMDREGLVYIPGAGKFVAKDRAWVVGSPEFAFMWPALTGRSPNPDAYMIYLGSPADVPHDFITGTLGCGPFLTRTEIRNLFEDAILQGMEDPDSVKPVLGAANYKFEQMLEQDVKLNRQQMQDLLAFAGVERDTAENIARCYDRLFGGIPQGVDDLYVKKYATAYAAEMKILEIKQKLNQAADALDSMTSGQGRELTLEIRRVAAGL